MTCEQLHQLIESLECVVYHICMVHPLLPPVSMKTLTVGGQNLTFPHMPVHPMLMVVFHAICVPCTILCPCMASRNGLVATTGVNFNYRL